MIETKCIIINFSSGNSLVLPVNSPAAMALALEEIMNSHEFISHLEYSVIKTEKDTANKKIQVKK